MNKDFFTHPLILKLKDDKRWTIPNNKKRPIDVRKLEQENIITLATKRNHECLMSLPELLPLIKQKDPSVTSINRLQYALRADLNHILCVDIEKEATPETFELFHNTNWIYAEKSASGKGAHYFYEVSTDLLSRNPFNCYASKKKTNLEFEVLLTQYVIFTGNLIPDNRSEKKNIEPILKDFFKPEKKIELNLEQIKLNNDYIKNIPEVEMILENISKITYEKTPEDFNGDTSSYEFGHLAKLCTVLQSILKTLHQYKGIKYSIEDEQHLMLYFALKYLPHREKHNRRDYLPNLVNSVIKRVKSQ